MGFTTWPTDGLRGPDVSRWQRGRINYPVAAQGMAFAFIKASQGRKGDPAFREHWDGFGAEDVGLLLAPYHFFDPRVDALKQATFFLDRVETMATAPDLPHVVDFERFGTNYIVGSTKKIPPDVWVNGVLGVLAEVEKRTSVVPYVYTGAGFFIEMSRGYAAHGLKFKPAAHAAELLRYRHWLVDYSPPADAIPGWSWDFWQFTGHGSLPGVKGDIDLNVFRGTSEEALTNLKAPGR